MKRILPFSLLLLAFLGFWVTHAQERSAIVVFAAASLTDSYEAIGIAFEEANPGVEVLFNFGGSSTLASQLVQGAPADVFASANPHQMMIAAEGGRIAEPIRTFARNRLVLIVPASNPANIQSLHDLSNPGVRLILAAPEVPVRAYTDTMLQQMALDSAYGEVYAESVIANIVSEEPNVRQVAAKVALGEADAGVVYLSDVTPDIADEVLTFSIPDGFNTIATYPIAVTNDTRQPELATRFVEFVLSEMGQDILVEWGFVSIRIPELPDTVTIPPYGSLVMDGQVMNPLVLTVESLQGDFAEQSVTVTDSSGETTYTGVLLWDVVNTAQPNLNADVRNDQLSMYIVVTGADGYQAVIAWGEIDPTLGNQPILLAYAEDGRPIADSLGDVRLIVPGDESSGRFVEGVAHISLRDAPPPAER
jgi:molybdate transport system substrate-binding protein